MSPIAIIGAGAIGSTIAAFLSRAGVQVTVIARPAQVEAIQRDGLKVEGRPGSFTARVDAAEKLGFRPDYAFLAVKTQDVLPALQANLEHLRDASLVTFQNGVSSDDIAAMLLPKPNITSAVVSISATHLAPGAVTVIYPGSLVIGHPFPESITPLDPLRDILNHAAPTTISQNIRGVHWLKLLFNLNNAFPALLNMSLHDTYDIPYIRSLSARVIREGLHAVDAAGIRLESLPEVTVMLFRMLGILPPPLGGLLIWMRARRIASQWPLLGSTLQSLRRGRPTEIDYLNGEIVRLAEQVHTAAPLNARLVELTHEVERTGQFLTVDELRARLETKN